MNFQFYFNFHSFWSRTFGIFNKNFDEAHLGGKRANLSKALKNFQIAFLPRVFKYFFFLFAANYQVLKGKLIADFKFQDRAIF